jgi:hypothetical protein
LTVYTGGRDTSAMISLSKLSGDSTAHAYIDQICYGLTPETQYRLVFEEEGESVINHLSLSQCIMFALRTDDSFAYAPILLLFHS